jgi:metal-dependent amidase/aminoacylase/carboxypeptidase family protein
MAAAHGAPAGIKYERRYPAAINSAREAAWAATVAATMDAAMTVQIRWPVIDGFRRFRFPVTEMSGSPYLAWGAGSATSRAPAQPPLYDFNDGIFGIGARYWVKPIEATLPCHKTHAAMLSAV